MVRPMSMSVIVKRYIEKPLVIGSSSHCTLHMPVYGYYHMILAEDT